MSKKDIKLLSLDLDGTTLTNENKLSPTVKTAIEKAIKNGIEVVAASGRPFATMPKEVLNIKGIDYVIASNGAAVYDKNRSCIRRLLLTPDEVLRLLEITKPYDLIFQAYIEGLTYTDSRYVSDPIKYGCTEAYVDYVRSAHGRIDDMRQFIYEHRHSLDSIEFIEQNEALGKMLWKQIEESTNEFYITSSTKGFVEFMARNATKANALEWLCSLLGIDKSQTAACGNADNDADMIKWAGMGAAVQNASPLCTENADLIVASNNDNGVAELIDLILG